MIKNVWPTWPTDFEYQKIPLLDKDNADLLGVLDANLEWINAKLANPKNRVLVHCSAGRSRSVSIIIGYLIKYRRMKLEDAYELVKEKRG